MKLKTITEVQRKWSSTALRRANQSNAITTPQIGDNTMPPNENKSQNKKPESKPPASTNS